MVLALASGAAGARWREYGWARRRCRPPFRRIQHSARAAATTARLTFADHRTYGASRTQGETKEAVATSMRNWAGNLIYGARHIHQPASVEQVQDIVRSARQVRALGSRHSFNDIADTVGDLVSLAGLPRVIDIDSAGQSVTVDGGIRYGDLCRPLHEAGFALHNLASLPHISVAGASATGTHGSGSRSGNLSTAVTALELVAADGRMVTLSRADDPDTFPGAVVSLGALGVVTSLTLQVRPTFQVRQDVFEDLPVAELCRHFLTLASMAESVSCFTEWRGPFVDQVWIKSRVGDGDGAEVPLELLGATRATVERHPIRRMSAVACTPQLGLPGPWFERLPHFRMEHTPSSGDELQTEYFVAAEDAVPAFMALHELRDRLAPLVQVSEIRTVAADDLWLSPAHERSSVAFHFTWRPDWPAVREVLPAVEAALAPYEPRPHWAKLSTLSAEAVRSRYDRFPAFTELVTRLDPEGKFRNEFLWRLGLPQSRARPA
jgi:alditol oxidase